MVKYTAGGNLEKSSLVLCSSDTAIAGKGKKGGGKDTRGERMKAIGNPHRIMRSRSVSAVVEICEKK